MSTEQVTLSGTGTTVVALAEEKLILPSFTTNQSKLSKENTTSPCVVLFLACFWAKKIDFVETKMQECKKS